MFVQVILNDVYVCVCTRASVYERDLCDSFASYTWQREREGEKTNREKVRVVWRNVLFSSARAEVVRVSSLGVLLISIQVYVDVRIVSNEASLWRTINQ